MWLVYDKALAVKRAVKYVSKSSIVNPTKFYNEPQTLMALRHENIVNVEDAGKNPDGSLYIAMEYLSRGSLETVFKGRPLPLKLAISLLKDICWALEFAHQNGYIHRDIKPANILLTKEDRGKLSDFGLATRVPRGGIASPQGYLTHVAPEVFRTGNTSKSSDIYALGVTAYRLINGDAFLPDNTEPSDIEKMIVKGDYPNRGYYRPYIPNNIQKIINKCMALKKIDRFKTPSEFRKALERIRIYCHWKFSRNSNSKVVYKTEINSSKIKVSIVKDKTNHFNISTIKISAAGNERRVLKDCYLGLTLVQMKKRIRQILPRYVQKGK